MDLCYRIFIPFLIQCLLYWAPVPTYASFRNCAGSSVTFEWDEAEKVACACSSANDSIAFLESIGLQATQPVKVKLTQQIPSSIGSNVIGLYAPANANEVIILNYTSIVEASQRNQPRLNINMSENVWCAYVAHELAHAISGQHLSASGTNRMAREYISAVTQLTVFSSATREAFLQKHSGVAAYQSIEEMSELYFLLDPNKFAVKCYLHFIALDDPKAFIGQLLEVREDF